MGKAIKNKMRGMNLWAKVGMILFVTMLMSSFITPVASFAAPTANGRITYSIGTTTPQSRSYAASTNTFAAAAATLANQIPTHIVEKACPTRNEHIIGYIALNGTTPTLYVMINNGGVFGQMFNVAVGTAGGTAIDGRRFDIAYEQTSGKAMIVYSTNATGTAGNEMAYRTWDGTTLSAAVNINSARLAQAAAVASIKLASKPGSNVIALAAQDSGTTTANTSQLTSFIWDGTTWGNEPSTAHTSSVTMTNTAGQLVQNDNFDLAYESLSGDLLVVWTSTADQNSRTYSAAGIWGAIAPLGTNRTPPNQMILASDPLSDKILMVFTRSGNTNVYSYIWSGTAFGSSNTAGTSSANPAIEQKQIAAAWLSQGGNSIAVVLFNGANANINYAFYPTSTSTWTNSQTWTPTGTNVSGGKRWMAVDVDPASKDTLVFTYSDTQSTASLWAKQLVFTGTATLTWSNADGGAALSTALATVTSQNFSFAYDRYFISTTVGDGTTPANKTVGASATNQGVSTFTLATNVGTDTVTGLTVTGTNLASNVSAVKIYRDNGGTANEWDATDTLIASGSIAGNVVTFSGLSLPVTTTPANYIITFDTTAAPINAQTLTAAVTAVTATNTVVNNDSADATLTILSATNTVGDGTQVFVSRNVYPSNVNQAVSDFTLVSSAGTDTVTGLVITGTNTANVSAVKIWQDNGSVVNNWDATDTLIATGTFSGTTATFTGLSIPVTTSATNYIITYDIVAAPTSGQTLTAAVTGVTATNPAVNNDNADVTLTIRNNATTVGAATATAYSPSVIKVSMPYTEDFDANNTYTVEYSLAGQNAWTAFVTAAAHVATPYSTSITGLAPGTSYDVRLTYNDTTGVTGTNPQIITVSTLPAGVDQLDAWTNVYSAAPGTISVTDVVTSSFTVSPGANRLLVAGVCMNMGATATVSSISVKLDNSAGVAFTPVAANSATAQREQCWMGYLKESNITTGTHTLDVSVTMSASTLSGLHVKVGSYQNVDQATPVASSMLNNAAATSVAFASSGTLSYNNNSAVVFITADGNTPATLADDVPAGYGFGVITAATSTANAHSSFISQVFKATSGSIPATATVSFGGTTSSRSAVVVAALSPALPTTTVAAPTAANGGNRNINVNPNCQQDGNGNNTVLIEWQVAGGDWSSLLGSNTGHCASFSIPNLTNGGIYDVRVTYSDADGLTGICSGTGPCQQVITPSVTVTEIRTIVLSGSAIANTPYTIDISMPYNYDTNINNTYTVDYKKTSDVSWTNLVTGAAHVVSPYTTTIAGLLPNTSYDVRLSFVDSNGVVGTNPQTITTSTPVENRTVAGVATAIENDTQSINFSMPYTYDMDGDNTYTIDYSVTGSGTWTNYVTAAAHAASPYTGTISGLTPGTRYDIRMTYNDAAGVTGTNPQTVTVLLPIDATTTGAMTFSPSDIQMVVNAAYSNDTNDNNSCVITWGTDGISYPNTAPAPTVDRVANKYTTTVTGLTPNTRYYFQATFTDSDGVTGANPVSASQKTAVAWANNPMLHNSTNMKSTKWGANGWGIPGGQYGAFTCSTCHIPNTSNIKWVRTSIDATGVARTVVYKNVTSAGHDNRAVKTSSYNVCEVCHSATNYHRYDATGNTDNTHNNGSVCNGCHPHSIGFAADMTNCIGCHDKVQAGTHGTPRDAITTEFGLAWGHKKAGRGAVTNADCLVCHLEGSVTGMHADGKIDLRDPASIANGGDSAITDISGNPFTFTKFATSYAAGSRTSNGHTSNTDVANVITQKFCLGCHNINGALNPKARSGTNPTQYLPFGTGSQNGATYTVGLSAGVVGGVVDVKSQLATSNRSYHPVMGPKTRDFPTAARMNNPYKPTGTRGTSGTLTQGVVLNCFDCHNLIGSGTDNITGLLTTRTVAAHGSNATTMVRGVATVSGTPSAANAVTFCVQCHASYLGAGQSHASGSAFSSGSTDSGMTAYVGYGCNICHSSGYTTAVPRPVRGQDTHGSNTLGNVGTLQTTVGRWSTDATPVAFIRNRQVLPRHAPLAMAAQGANPAWASGTQCMGGNVSPCSQGTKTYTVGGTF